MKLTDIFIRRPVLACAISLLIFVAGLHSAGSMEIRQYPKMDNTVITVTTVYSGASSDTIEGFITQPISQNVATAEGIDYLESTSSKGQSQVTAYIKLNHDPNAAFTDIMAKVQQTLNVLPRQSQQPQIVKSTGGNFASLYLAFSSTQMSAEQVTDYVSRAVVPQLETISGISQAQVLGGSVFAMRIWLDTQKMAAYGVTPSDVSNVLSEDNFQSAAGATKGEYTTYYLNGNTNLTTPEEFRNIIVKNKGNDVVHLSDIAKIQLGAQNYDSGVTFNSRPAVFIGINLTPSANPLTVIDNVVKMLPSIQKQLPPGFVMKDVYDSTVFIRSSIKEVVSTILEAAIIVIIVIFCFLGSARSVIIPVVTIPLSIVGVCTLMLALGYSINLLTLLAMVLAIGLVVDDAIVVVENIYRHIENGETPFNAAIHGTREITGAIVSMTITLAAVYAPIGFMGGLTGALFKEFAFTLAATVIISGILALVLSPMMCSKVLNKNISSSRIVTFIDRIFSWLQNKYQNLLHRSLNFRPVTLLFAVAVLVSCYFLFTGIPQELAPTEDQGVILVSSTAPTYANYDYLHHFSNDLDNAFKAVPFHQNYFNLMGAFGSNNIISMTTLSPWDDRDKSTMQLTPLLQQKLSGIAGLQSVAFSPPSLPGNSGGMPIEFVITSLGNFQDLYTVSNEILQKAKQSGFFAFLQNSLTYDRPEYNINIDRQKAQSLGITMENIGNALSGALSGNYINFINIESRSYQVIPEILRKFRYNPQQMNNIYVKTAQGKEIPLSTLVTITPSVEPVQRTQFNQINSATLEGQMAPGVSMGTALAYLKSISDKTLPSSFAYDYEGQSRQYIQEGDTLVYVFIFAIIIIYLVLCGLFESFRDPFTTLISVPMSICGALIPLYLGAATLNIYSEIGLVTLIGLISKHGILMVDFANKLQVNEGLSIREAIEKSASLRLRPILMTTFAMVFGVLPLIFASGAGAASRFNIGLVIACGMAIGTCFTLFVVPTIYTFIASRHHQLEAVDEESARHESNKKQ